MSVNSSSNSSNLPPPDHCHGKSISISTALFISYILLLPLFLLVLYVGFKRWRKQSSVATATKTSHSDVFTFNVVVLELMGVIICGLYCYAVYTDNELLILVGLNVFSIIQPGQTLFHLLTCVDRYLAVVHPVTYLRLRQRGGVRIRNVSVVFVWLLCFLIPTLSMFIPLFNIIFSFLLFAFCVVGVSFCSISVLCVLIRPGPGEVGGKRERVDQSKLRAFYTIMAIMAALLLRFFSVLISTLAVFTAAFHSDMCTTNWSAAFFSLPSSLVLPLLFLHRAGKLPGCKHDAESG